MKNLLKNYLSSTALILIAISIVAVIFKADFVYISTVFQVMTAELIVHLGLLLTRKFYSSYRVLENMLELVIVLCVILVSGYVFNWFSFIPAWIIIIMVIVIYGISCVLDIVKVRKDIQFINQQLQLRNGRKCIENVKHETKSK